MFIVSRLLRCRTPEGWNVYSIEVATLPNPGGVECLLYGVFFVADTSRGGSFMLSSFLVCRSWEGGKFNILKFPTWPIPGGWNVYSIEVATLPNPGGVECL